MWDRKTIDFIWFQVNQTYLDIGNMMDRIVDICIDRFLNYLLSLKNWMEILCFRLLGDFLGLGLIFGGLKIGVLVYFIFHANELCILLFFLIYHFLWIMNHIMISYIYKFCLIFQEYVFLQNIILTILRYHDGKIYCLQFRFIRYLFDQLKFL